jgi:hypothetical protein
MKESFARLGREMTSQRPTEPIDRRVFGELLHVDK